MYLVFSHGFLGEFAEEGKWVGFVVSGLHHHEDGHGDEYQLNEAMEMKAGDALQDGAQHLIVQQPGDEKVQPLKSVEADDAVLTETTAGQHDDGGNPADARDVAEDRGGTGIDGGQGIAHGGFGVGRSSVGDRLLDAAPRTVESRPHLVSALAAKRHLLIHTLFLLMVFRQLRAVGRLPWAPAAGHNRRMRTLCAGILLVASAAILPAARNLEIYAIDVEGGQATLIVSPSGESMLVDTGWGAHN